MGGPKGQDPPHQVQRRSNRLPILVTPGDASRRYRHPSSSSRLPGGVPAARRLPLPLPLALGGCLAVSLLCKYPLLVAGTPSKIIFRVLLPNAN